MNNEIFGPILNVYEYTDVHEALELCSNNDYGLTGSIFTNIETNFMIAEKYLQIHVTITLMINALVQLFFNNHLEKQKSGTNDKAGSKYLLPRFGNNRILKLKNKFIFI